MHRRAELLRRGIGGIIRRQLGVVGFVAIGAPMTLISAGIGVIHDHAPVAVTVGDIKLVGLGVHQRLGRQPEVGGVVASLALTGLADLHQEFAGLGKLQDHVV